MFSKSPYCVLVVVDEAENATPLCNLLTPEGYTVQVATDGASALQLAQQSPPDLVLLAVSLPGMDGYTVCQQLKQNDATRHIPVVFLYDHDNDHADCEAEARCFAVGGVDFIRKPVKQPVLLARVSAHMATHQQQRHLEGMFRDVMEFSPDALVLSDMAGRIVRMNRQAEELSGYTLRGHNLRFCDQPKPGVC